MATVKPKNIKMISTTSVSLSHTERASPLSLMHPNECVCVCMINRETHSLFILFCSHNVHFNMSAPLNSYLLELTSLAESNKPSAPQLWGLFPPINKEG